MESRSAASPKPISWHMSGCLVLAKFPEPDGTGGEPILGLAGEQDVSEWQIVLLECQWGSVPFAHILGTCFSAVRPALYRYTVATNCPK